MAAPPLHLYWFRNDLRLHDNPGLARALAAGARVLPVYVFDTRLFTTQVASGFRKTGPHRAEFLRQAVTDLRERLADIGAGLVVRTSTDPAATVADLARTQGAVGVYGQAEITSEETSDERALAARLPAGCSLTLTPGKALYHPEDLPFPPDGAPEPFRAFRKSVERLPVREPLPEPHTVPQPAFADWGELPTLTDLGFAPDETGSPAYPGGETAALQRLYYYLDETHLVKRYRATRNQSLGPDYSSKFSPYLAVGNLSPRLVYAEIQRYSTEQKNRGGQGVIFEMRWRDFFLYMGRKHGDRIFRAGGLKNRATDWQHDPELFDNWRAGQTGLPFIDAHMRELMATGFMSNRGRVNCASFLTRDYRIDWRWGAAWFENRLVDYEVCANWFNWHTQALEIYYTSAPWQGLKYDRAGAYVKHWLPELAELPAPLVHAPWKMADEGMLDDLAFDLERDYHRPRVENSKWDWAWQRLKTGDASSPRRKKNKANSKDK